MKTMNIAEREIDYYDPQFCGTDNHWSLPSGGFKYCDSIKHFCTEYQAYWTLDVVNSYIKELKEFGFAVIYFDVKDGKCTFHVKRDSNLPDIVCQEIPFTDLTVSVKWFLEEGVLLFPSDH